MRVKRIQSSVIGAVLILATFSSVSEARWFRGGYGYYYVPAYSACQASTAQTSPMPAAAPAAPAGATAYPATAVYQANKVPSLAAQPLPARSPAANSAPAYAPGGYSVSPRNAWDFGRFPPYH